MRGVIFNIQRFCVQDGPGIRTTVFFKGCPLRCAWCHNPESQRSRPEILYSAEKCALCGACAAACPKGLHRVDGAGHAYDRARCDG
ncbi:MAG: 4Fe-4S cluster-binding domain-containing protein, partial [Clostridia bacterium]|nr:4Fe-4S cluster-binding domain-containing protein [Clostridia bacterium]